METMPMSGGGAMSMTWMSMGWMPMCGRSWVAAGASFLAMWALMMAAMMLPSWVPMLWRCRRSVGSAGELPRLLPTALVAGGYLFVWALLGAAVYPLGAVAVAAGMSHPSLARAAPAATGLVVLAAAALQFTRWKARHLACCAGRCRSGSRRDGGALAADPLTAFRHGLRLGAHCCQCCAGLTAVLLAGGIMDVPVMAAVTAGITLERLAPGGKRAARAIGVALAGMGVFLTVRGAAGLS